MDDPHSETAEVCELVTELLARGFQDANCESQNVRDKGRVDVSDRLDNGRTHLHSLRVLLRLSVTLGYRQDLLHKLALLTD